MAYKGNNELIMLKCTILVVTFDLQILWLKFFDLNLVAKGINYAHKVVNVCSQQV